jgi:hypothetical protein
MKEEPRRVCQQRDTNVTRLTEAGKKATKRHKKHKAFA